MLHPLACQDIQGLTDVLWGEMEGTRRLSWIWTMSGTMASTMASTTDDVGLEGMSQFAYIYLTHYHY